MIDSISLIERLIAIELSQYNNLPIHLTFLYLKFRDRNVVPVRELSVASAGQFEVRFSNSLNRLVFFKGTDTTPLSMPLRISKTVKLTIHTPWIIKDKVSRTKNYVYSRNSNLCSLIGNLCRAHFKIQGNVPYYLVFPYLYLNRGDYLYVLKGKDKLKLIFDNQNKSLKIQSPRAAKKYQVLSQGYVIIILYNNTKWPAGVLDKVLYLFPTQEANLFGATPV